MIRRGTATIAAVFAAYLIGRVIILLGGEAYTAHDSAVYAYRTDPALNHGPLVSFVGHAPRTWGVPLFNAIFQDDYSRAIAQWALGSLAWAMLAWAVIRNLATQAAKVVAAVGVLGLGLLRTIASWDFAILSESLSLSLGALTLAFTLIWLQSRAIWSIIATVVTAVWWTFVRPDIRFFTGMLCIALAVVAWRRWRVSDRKQQWANIIAALMLVGAFAWYAAIIPATNEAFKPYSGTSLKDHPLPTDEENFVYRLRVDVSTDPQLKETFHTKLGMPACAGTDAFQSRPEWETVEFTKSYVACPELKAWGEQYKNRFWSALLIHAPDQFARKFGENLSQMFGGDIYAKTGWAIPPPWEKVVFPSWRYGLPVALVGVGAALALAMGAGVRRATPLLFTTGVVLTSTALGSAVLSVFVASGEYRRFGVQETVAVRLAMVIFVACAIDVLIRRSRERKKLSGAELKQSHSQVPHTALLLARVCATRAWSAYAARFSRPALTRQSW